MNANNANNNQHQQGAAFSVPTQFGFPAGMQFQGMPNQQVPGGGWFGMNMGMPPTPARGGAPFGAAFAGQPEEAQQNQNNNSGEDTSAGDGGAAASNNGGNRQHVPAAGGQQRSGEKQTMMELIVNEAGKYTSDLFKEELELLEKAGTSLHTELMGATKPVCVLYMKEKTPFPQLLHSLAVCESDGVDYVGDVVGFNLHNHPKVLLKKAWQVRPRSLPAVEYLRSLAKDDNEEEEEEEEEMNPLEEIKNTIQFDTAQNVPYLMVCPTALVKKLVLSGKNVYEGFVWLCKEFPDENDLKQLKQWFVAAMYRDQLKLNMNTVETMDEKFYQWMDGALDSKHIAGAGHSTASNPQQQTAAGSSDPNMMYWSMLVGLQQQQLYNMQCQTQHFMLQQQQSYQQGTTAKKIDPSLEALKCGFAGVKSTAHLPPFYDDVEGLDSQALDRYIKGTFTEALTTWAAKHNKTIRVSWDLEAENIMEWRKGKFGIGSKGMYEAGSEGMSPFNAVAVTTEQVNRRRARKEARNQASHTLTFNETVQLNKEKWEPLDPPMTLTDLTDVLVVFQGMLAVVHGELCDLYIAVTQVVGVLELKHVLELKEKFRGIVSMKIFWAVVVESRRFFNECMTPSQLQSADPPFPSCGLRHILRDVENARKVDYPDFPPQWLQRDGLTAPRDRGNHNKANQQLQSGVIPQAQQQFPGFQAPAWGQMPPYFPGPQQGNMFLPQYVPSGPQPQSQAGAMIPPQIVVHLTRAQAAFKDVTHRHIIEAAGKTMKDLPKNNGKVVCYLALFGHCKRAKCEFAHFYSSAELTVEFISEWEAIIREGVDKILAGGKLPTLANGRKRKKAQE